MIPNVNNGGGGGGSSGTNNPFFGLQSQSQSQPQSQPQQQQQFAPPFGLSENGKIFNPPLLVPPHPQHQSHSISSNNTNSSSKTSSNSRQTSSQQQPVVNNNSSNSSNNNSMGENSALKQLRDIADRSAAAGSGMNMFAAAAAFQNPHLLNEFTKFFESQV